MTMRLEKDQFLKQKPFNSRMPYSICFSRFWDYFQSWKRSVLEAEALLAFLKGFCFKT